MCYTSKIYLFGKNDFVFISAPACPARCVYLADQRKQADSVPAGQCQGHPVLHRGRGAGQGVWQGSDAPSQGNTKTHLGFV